MLRILLNLIFFVLILGLVRSLFRVLTGAFRRGGHAPKVDGDAKTGTDNGYSDLTPYEIEDAEYEEIGKK